MIAKILKIANAMRRGLDVPMADGPRIERFDPHKIAAAIEMEVARAKVNDWQKVSLHMDLSDALKLARILNGVRK